MKTLLIVTFFSSNEDNLSLEAKEKLIANRNRFVYCDHRKIRFFHSWFQSIYGTLKDIMGEEKSGGIHIAFQRNVPNDLEIKIIEAIKENNELEKIAISSSLSKTLSVELY